MTPIPHNIIAILDKLVARIFEFALLRSIFEKQLVSLIGLITHEHAMHILKWASVEYVTLSVHVSPPSFHPFSDFDDPHKKCHAIRYFLAPFGKFLYQFFRYAILAKNALRTGEKIQNTFFRHGQTRPLTPFTRPFMS